MFSRKIFTFAMFLFSTTVFFSRLSHSNMCMAASNEYAAQTGGGSNNLNLQSDHKNCGRKGRACSQIEYCSQGQCASLPKQSMFCAEERKWCMATCNDGWVVRNLCSPCKDACKSACKDHNGCKSTCSELTEVDFTKKCILA